MSTLMVGLSVIGGVIIGYYAHLKIQHWQFKKERKHYEREAWNETNDE